jgi:phosphatidate cytidylyltransferase
MTGAGQQIVSPPPHSSHRRKPSAGRNLPAAIGVGVVLGGAILASLLIYRPAFVALVAAAVVVALWELGTAVGTKGMRPPFLPLAVGGAGMLAGAWWSGIEALLVGLLLTVVAVALWRLADGPEGYQRDVTVGALMAVYVPFLAGFAVLTVAEHRGPLRIIAFIATVVCNDTGGYVSGVLFGRHPMAPTVSPKKSWEGFAGSLVACVLCGVGLLVFAFHDVWWHGVVFGLAVAVTATLGDLGESMIKRDLDVKDMSSLLPGHGGLMDRLDSLLPTAPVAYLLLHSFLS